MSWFDSGWRYRKSVAISRPSGSVTNYQMKLLIMESSGSSTGNVSCDGKCLSSFDDLRFTNSNGVTLLDYWVESISGTTPNQLATVWVEFDSIETITTVFYMYYGNMNLSGEGGSSVSSGANTFLFFDDFERGSNGDAVGGDWTTAGCKISTDHAFSGTRCMKIPGAASDWGNSCYKSYSVNTSDIAIKFNFWKEDAAAFAFWVQNNTKAAEIWVKNTELVYAPDATYLTIACKKDSWDSCEINNIRWSSSLFDIYFDLVSKTNAGTNTDSTSDRLSFYDRISGVGNDTYIDNFIIRNYRYPEPILGAWGTEEKRRSIYIPFRGKSRFLNYTIE